MPPQIDPANPKVISKGPSLCMFKKQDPQEMAATWLFMKFLTTNMGLQANFSSVSGYTPVIQDLGDKYSIIDPERGEIFPYAEELALAELGNAHLQMACVKQCFAQTNSLFVSPAFVGSSGARDQVGLLMQRCFVKVPGANQTVADLVQAEFTEVINKLRYDYGA
jgi:multiple sugar transport system substrate-binding protein